MAADLVNEKEAVIGGASYPAIYLEHFLAKTSPKPFLSPAPHPRLRLPPRRIGKAAEVATAIPTATLTSTRTVSRAADRMKPR